MIYFIHNLILEIPISVFCQLRPGRFKPFSEGHIFIFSWVLQYSLSRHPGRQIQFYGLRPNNEEPRKRQHLGDPSDTRAMEGIKNNFFWPVDSRT